MRSLIGVALVLALSAILSARSPGQSVQAPLLRRQPYESRLTVESKTWRRRSFAAAPDTGNATPPPVSTVQLVAGGLVGGAIGASARLRATRDMFNGDEGGIGLDEFYKTIVLFTLGESLGISGGVYAANRGRGHLVRASLVSIGTGLAGFVLATGIAKTAGPGTFLLIPVAQIAATIAAER